MFNRLRGIFYAISTLIILCLSTTLSFIPVFCLGLLKLIPNRKLKVFCTQTVDNIATLWTDINNRCIDVSNPAQIKVTGIDKFNKKNWYLVIANHQSWLDIVILQHVFNRRIPILKFFIKDQLKWIPFLGFAWWTMGFPFMKRYSKEYIEKNPHKRHKDTEATQKALRTFQLTPSSIMNFVEGTRFTAQKKRNQNSPYQHLLKPKAGGISLVVSAMNKHFTHLLDVTIIYSDKQHSLWDFLCHRISAIDIHVRELPIPKQFLHASLAQEAEHQSEFRKWINQQWLEKDKIIADMTHKYTLDFDKGRT
jgi:1-acyl-sn-glycerol-3-phosphate acyltransferase